MEAANTPEAGTLAELQMLQRTSAHIHNDGQWTGSMCQAAASTGNVPVMEFLWGKVPHPFWDQACSAAYAASQMAALRWLLQQEPRCPFELGLPSSEWRTLSSSICGNQDWKVLEVHRRLPSPGLLEAIPKDAYACREAAAAGNVELMAWLRANDAPWDARACNLAAANGHTMMLQFLRSQTPPCEWCPRTC